MRHELCSSQEIHDRLKYGLPITVRQTRWLYEKAFGEKFENRKRCKACNAEGCGECKQSGYQQ